MGLVIFMVMGVYLLISLGVVAGAVVYAQKHGKRAWLWALAAAFVMYNLVFWDWIPTVVAHRYYCEKEAGFWVYKTLEQWKAENPGVMETLPAQSKTGSPTKYEQFDDEYGETTTFLLNERFNWVVTQQDTFRLLPIIRMEQQVKDVKKNNVLARYVDFGTGNSVKNKVGPPGPLKFWLRNGHCNGGDRNSSLMWQFTEQFYGSKK